MERVIDQFSLLMEVNRLTGQISTTTFSRIIVSVTWQSEPAAQPKF